MPSILRTFLAHHNVKAALRLTFGWIFIGLGIVGLFVPILQGILFIAVGIALLADHIPFFAKIRNSLYRRFPKLERLVRRVRARIRLVHRRLGHKSDGPHSRT
ncbi:MAG: hypothetical protein HN341_02365 [Verrucomicrobia bacterium]|nr:hypothetical protein [Verrucomicrobiota bacterium]